MNVAATSIFSATSFVLDDVDPKDVALKIDVAEHDCRVVAAQLQREALERPGGAGHHLLAGCGGAGESDHGHVGVSGEGGAEVVLIDDDVDYAWRQNPGAQFTELQRRQRRGRCR